VPDASGWWRVSPRGPNEPTLALLESRAREIADAIAPVLPPGTGFCLMLFTFGEGRWATYVSNAQRESMIAGVRELLDRLEGSGEADGG
jgi:hypothetical protein